MRCLRYSAPGTEPPQALLVMLPGIGIDAVDFAGHGLVAAVHDRGLPVDIVAARPDLDRYLDGTVDAEIRQAILEPARAAGYPRIWFLSISLGGMGALLSASAAESDVAGVILLAPFLATQGTLAEITEAGGLLSWSPERSRATDMERRLLAWLTDVLARQPVRPALYLGYGRSDRFAHGHAMLADCLPSERVVTVDGGHDWAAWVELWRRLLDLQPFALDAGATGKIV